MWFVSKCEDVHLENLLIQDCNSKKWHLPVLRVFILYEVLFFTFFVDQFFFVPVYHGTQTTIYILCYVFAFVFDIITFGNISFSERVYLQAKVYGILVQQNCRKCFL